MEDVELHHTEALELAEQELLLHEPVAVRHAVVERAARLAPAAHLGHGGAGRVVEPGLDVPARRGPIAIDVEARVLCGEDGLARDPLRLLEALFRVPAHDPEVGEVHAAVFVREEVEEQPVEGLAPGLNLPAQVLFGRDRVSVRHGGLLGVGTTIGFSYTHY